MGKLIFVVSGVIVAIWLLSAATWGVGVATASIFGRGEQIKRVQSAENQTRQYNLFLPFLPTPPKDARFATAGPTTPDLGFYHYTWDSMSDPNPPDQTVPESFFRVVGKLDNRHDGLSCNPCTDINTQLIEAAEEPKIRDLLSRPVNLGGTWMVGNEPNYYPKIDAATYAHEFIAYRDFIHSIDPTAKIGTGGVLYLGWLGVSPDVVTPPEEYMEAFLYNMGQNRPDIYAVHFYPSGYDYIPNNLTQASNFKTYLVGKGEGSKPIWVTEFGMNVSATYQQTASYMDQMLGVFAILGYARWFWFIGSSEPGYEQTALTSGGAVTNLGQHYENVARTALNAYITR